MNAEKLKNKRTKNEIKKIGNRFLSKKSRQKERIQMSFYCVLIVHLYAIACATGFVCISHRIEVVANIRASSIHSFVRISVNGKIFNSTKNEVMRFIDFFLFQHCGTLDADAVGAIAFASLSSFFFFFFFLFSFVFFLLLHNAYTYYTPDEKLNYRKFDNMHNSYSK